ncbi:MAG: IMPACT family protein [Bacteroidota bacterium]
MGLFSDVYYEVERDAEFVLRERGSKFYAYVYGVRSEVEVKEKLEGLKREYPDATHHCYAWVMGARGEGQRANDDGEPGNSAGRPILRTIISAGLTNVLVVVVRYFGGTMLGIPGLIEAYGGSSSAALRAAGRVEKYIEEVFEVTSAFEHEQEIHRLVAKFGVRVLGSEYRESVTYRLAVKAGVGRAFEQAVMDHYQLTGKLVLNS